MNKPIIENAMQLSKYNCIRLLHLSINLLLLLFLAPLHLYAQINSVNIPHIKSLRITANNNWLAPPVIQLNTDDFIEISFDELTHEYHRYTYKIVHCNADWTQDELFETDYMSGFNNNTIDEYHNSLNTTMLYTHYKFQLPNENAQLLISGNYMVFIYGEDDDENPVLQACFSVISPQVGVSASVSSNTDIDTNVSHQQVSFTVNHKGMNVNSPQTEFKAKVFQNLRTDNCVTDILPTYLKVGEMQYVHNRKLIFEAGNEYRRFEVANLHYATQGIDEMLYFEPYYHATLYPDRKRSNYSYDEDQNGRYYIRYNQAQDSEIEADYIFVHFSLEYDKPLLNGNFYLNGQFTYNSFLPEFALKYNPEKQVYEGVQLLKQGAYNWQYLFVPDGSTRGQSLQAEGNFYETENEYLILIYHRPFGGRYDKLVGMQSVKFIQ